MITKETKLKVSLESSHTSAEMGFKGRRYMMKVVRINDQNIKFNLYKISDKNNAYMSLSDNGYVIREAKRALNAIRKGKPQDLIDNIAIKEYYTIKQNKREICAIRHTERTKSACFEQWAITPEYNELESAIIKSIILKKEKKGILCNLM